MMTRPFVVTGAASGIGAATVGWLAARGQRTIGVDCVNAQIVTDLSCASGREEMRDKVSSLAPDGIEGIIACAGIAGEDGGLMVAVNYFGAVATLELLRPLLAGAERPRAVLIASSALLLPADAPTVKACLAGCEAEAMACARAAPDEAYPSSKLAVRNWMRRAAVSAEWAGQRIALNAVAPGTIRTPMTTPFLATEEGRAVLRRSTPIAGAEYGEPADVAEVIGFLASMETHYLLGQTIFVDGGTEVLLHAAVDP